MVRRQREGGRRPEQTCALKEEYPVTGRSVRRRKEREIEDTGKIGYFWELRHRKSQEEMGYKAQGVIINLTQEIQLDVREGRKGQGRKEVETLPSVNKKPGLFTVMIRWWIRK